MSSGSAKRGHNPSREWTDADANDQRRDLIRRQIVERSNGHSRMSGALRIMHALPRLVAFDVDGTLLRDETVCECIGRHLGKREEMTLIEQAKTLEEVAAARRQMLTWYLPHGREAILEY